jgi:hypothetical protein
MAAVRYLKNRINNYHLNAESKRLKREIIKHILQANKYDASVLDNLPKTKNKKGNNGIKWARFTYTGKETKSITKLLKNSLVKISYTTHNTIARLFTEKFKLNKNKFESSGVYQLTCPDCNMKYIGQTDYLSLQGFPNISETLNMPLKSRGLHNIFWNTGMPLGR